jgi:hypothetical protein
MARCRSSSRNCQRSRPIWSRTWCRTSSPSQAFSASCAGRARLDPRSRDHPRRHCRWNCRFAKSGDTHRTRARAIVAPAVCPVHRPGWLFAADRDVGQMGTGVRRVVDRTRRRAATGDAAVAPVRIYLVGPRTLRGGRPRGRSAGPGNFVERSAIRARYRRALPGADACPVAKRNSSARAPQDCRQYLAILPGA